MDDGLEYTFTSSEQFYAALQEIINIVPNQCSLIELDYALRSYIAFASKYMDQYLPTPEALDFALQSLLTSPLFTSHPNRMTSEIISLLNTTTPSSQIFISLMLILELGLTNPLSISSNSNRSNYTSKSTQGYNPTVFKSIRYQFKEIVPILIQSIMNSSSTTLTPSSFPGEGGERSMTIVGGTSSGGEKGINYMPNEGWEERVGTAATAVLYQVCRVQKLSQDELAIFSPTFISHLFHLVEKTRDAEDETFNYTLIALIIALNEQYMLLSLPVPASSNDHHHHDKGKDRMKSDHGHGSLVEPILPTLRSNGKGKGKEVGNEEEKNLVLRVLKNSAGDSKTFGENIIFILNRANGSNDSLCTSLLILKILYLLFTTTSTQEYFYTNDLCVLVDVFIRELCDLEDDSEGLKHTYLRVLHPLLTNTQLRHHPYKRPQLHRVLTSLISNSSYREVDSTTKRLVERNLKASWADGITTSSPLIGSNNSNNNSNTAEGRNRKGSEEESIRGWSSGMGGRRGTTASNISIHSNHSIHSNPASEDLLANINEGGDNGILASDISERIKELRLGAIGESTNGENGNGGIRSTVISREGSMDSVDQIASTDDHGTGRRKSMRISNREEDFNHPIINLPGSNDIYTAIQTDYYSTLPRSSSPLSFPPSSSPTSSTGSPKPRNASLPLHTSNYNSSSSTFNDNSLLIPPIAAVNRRRSASLLSPITQRLVMEDIIERPNSSFDSSSTSTSVPSTPHSSEYQSPDSPSIGTGGNQKQQRRKAPPPPPMESISRARTPSIISVASSINSNHSNHSNGSDSGIGLERVGEGKVLPCLPSIEKRRAAPEPPSGGRSSRNSAR